MAKNRANNNNKNNKEQRITTVIDYTPSGNHLLDRLSPSIGAKGTEVFDLQQPLGLPDPKEEYKTPVISLAEVDPNLPWDFIKLDLFDNSKDPVKQKLRLAMQIKKTQEDGFLKYNALLNSEFRFMKRGLSDDEWNSDHYQLVKSAYKDFKQEFGNANASKFYKPRSTGLKGVSVSNLSVILSQCAVEGEYACCVIYKDNLWVWKLKGHKGYLTDAQRRAGIIATKMIRKGQIRKMLNAEDELG